MFDILAASYMSATRMDHYLEQDFLHKDPMISRRLRYIHGLDEPNPSLARQLRGRIGMDGSIERARKPSRVAAAVRSLIARLGSGLRRLGAWMEGAAETSFQRQACADC